MKKEHLKVFYLLDNYNYLVKENPNLKKILKTLKNDYYDYDVQNFIDKLISWYNVKYSDVFLKSFLNEEINTDTTILNVMNFDVLRKSFGVFENELFGTDTDSKEKVILQKYLVVMAGWGMIYNKESNPKYGYYRASELFRDFNSFYSWNLTPSIYLPTLKKDYSPSNEENIQLIEKKKRHQRNSHEKKKKKSLFRKRILFI